MKTKLSIFAAVLALAAVSCEVELENEMAPVTAQTAVISASVEQQVDAEATRTALGDDNTIVWCAQDTISVFNTDTPSVSAKYYLADGEGTSDGKFGGTPIESEAKIAVYPASFSNGTPSVSEGVWSVPVSIPDTQVYVEGSIPTDANLAVALGSDNLAFKNVCGVVKIQIYAKSAYTTKQIQIAAAEPLAGDAVISYDGENAPTLEFTGNTSKVLTISIPAGIKLSTDKENPTVVYAVVPAGAFAGGLTVGLKTTSTIGTPMRTTKDNTIIRSSIHTMPVQDNAMSFPKYISALANTYMVEPSGEVTIYPYKPDGTLFGHIKSAGVAVAEIISAVSGSSCKGTVSNYTSYSKYAAAEYEGSVVLTAKDKDGIIWTWTVWTTDTPADLTLADGTVIMDRNLGATASTPSDITSAISETWGLKYQWGRKDPLFNAKTNYVETSETVGTLEYALANPSAYIGTADGVTYSGDWLWSGDDTLWGSTKTNYDPCPAGYMIPNGGTKGIYAANAFADKAGEYDSTNNGFYVAVLDGGDTAWFPRGQVNYCKDGALATANGGYYWCYPTVGMTDGSHKGRIMKLISTGITNSTTADKSYGCYIRCQKIAE